MHRILAQIRKDLIQILRDRLALALVLVLPVAILFLLGTSIALTVSQLPIIVQDFDGSPASRDLTAAFRASNSLYVTAWPADKPAARGVYFESGKGRAHHSRALRTGCGARREFARAVFGRWLGFEYGEPGVGRRGADRSRIQHDNVWGGAAAAGRSANTALVQPGAFEQEIFRSRRVRACHVDVRASARFACHGQRGREEDDTAGLRFEYSGTRISSWENHRLYFSRACRMRSLADLAQNVLRTWLRGRSVVVFCGDRALRLLRSLVRDQWLAL